MTSSPTPSRTFDLRAQGSFDFTQSIDFWRGFGLANAGEGAHESRIDLAFVPFGSERAVGVRTTAIAGGLHAEIFGEAPDRIEQDVARIFSLDVDGRGYDDMARRNPELERLFTFFPGSRPVLFPSPYEAAAWAIISQRVRMTQAAKIKANLERELGERVRFPDTELSAFPAPGKLRTLGPFPGLMMTKIERLHALAELAGELLDPARLRSLAPEEADAQVRQIPGIGSFSAELILLRGAGFPDQLPLTGQHISEGIARLYHLNVRPTDAQVREIAERWQPFRGWIAFLLHRLFREEIPLEAL